jgi:hypothetical protein
MTGPLALPKTPPPEPDAILDRLIHNAPRIELDSKESLRKDCAALNHGGHSDKQLTCLRRFAPTLSAITESRVRHEWIAQAADAMTHTADVISHHIGVMERTSSSAGMV